MTLLWAPNTPAVDWTQTNLDRHQGAYEQAKADFVRDNERQPETHGDYSAILRRAEAIRKGNQ